MRRIAESEIMDAIAAVEERSVNVKQVSVCGIPVESGTYESLLAGVRSRQGLHLGWIQIGPSGLRVNYRTSFCFSSDAGFSLRTGRRPTSRNWRTSSFSSAIVRLSV